jgi:hypothetical protein
MLELQEVKVGKPMLLHKLCDGKLTSISGLSEAALGEGTGAKLHKLSVKQIKSVSVTLNIKFFCEVNIFLI